MGKGGIPPLEDRKKYHINKAIETADLLWVDDTLVKPYGLDGKKLGYNDLSTGEDCFCNIDNVEIKSYEEGAL